MRPLRAVQNAKENNCLLQPSELDHLWMMMATNAMALAIMVKRSASMPRVWAGASMKYITEMIASLTTRCMNQTIWQRANAWANLWHPVFGWLASFSRCVLEQTKGNSKTSISNTSGTFVGSTKTKSRVRSECIPLFIIVKVTSEIKVIMLIHVSTIALALYKILIHLSCPWSQRKNLRRVSKVKLTKSRFDNVKIERSRGNNMMSINRPVSHSSA